MRRIQLLVVVATFIAAGALACERRETIPDERKPAAGPLSRDVAHGFGVVRELSVAPGNVAVTAGGRIILSLHQFFEPATRVVELLPDGTLEPFPNEEWANGPEGKGPGFASVLGLRSNGAGTIWLLDNGLRGGHTPKLVGRHVIRDEEKLIELPGDVLVPDSFLNDLVVDPGRKVAYIADPAGGQNAALVIVDLKNGKARRVLQGHRSVVPEDIDLNMGGEVIKRQNAQGEWVPLRVGVDPITIDHNYERLYFGPMSGRTLYRVRTADLLNEELSDAELGERVEAFAPKPICDGITIDNAGNVYVTDLEASAIGVIRPGGEYEVLIRDDLLAWPDGMSVGPDNFIYVTVSELHNSPVLNEDVDAAEAPFYVVRFKPLAEASVGR